jgi:hypothetical protein
MRTPAIEYVFLPALRHILPLGRLLAALSSSLAKRSNIISNKKSKKI